MKNATILLALLVAACSADDSDSGAFPPINPLDVTIPDLPQEPDSPPDVPMTRVALDLERLLRPTEGQARVYQVEREDQLISGGAAHGRIGDWIVENDRVRFLIEGDDRVMNPCPYGGNILDVSYLEGPSQDDILGEVCLFINATQTLDPDIFEVIPTDNGAAVLAVTGTIQLGDYLNIPGMVQSFLPGVNVNFPFDLNALLPATLTIYYILHPGELGVRVVTALRNDGSEEMSAVIAHLFMSGGDGRFFNPYGDNRGFGGANGSLGESPVSFTGFMSEHEGTMFVPEPTPDLSTAFPRGGTSLYVSGVTAIASGVAGILATLTSRQFKDVPGVITLQPGETAHSTHWQFAGDGALSTMLDEVYPLLGYETGELKGRVLDASGTPRAGAKVTAITVQPERTMGQAITAADGTYSMRVPTGLYRVSARIPGVYTPAPQQVTSVLDQTTAVPDIELSNPASVSVQIRNPDGEPVPGRLTVICEGPCQNMPTSRDADITFDRLPSDWFAVVYAGMDGHAELDLPAGNYRLVVTRGFEWTMWPYNARASGGELVSLGAGDIVEFEAEIAHVMDTSGALSADFHVHALPSPDSPVPIDSRVLNFLAEGVDVVVSTDHDIIADYRPSIVALGAEREITSIVGVEITTGSTGHYNAFPVQYDPTHRRGGALDWGRDRGNDMDPKDIFAWVRELPGEQVIQINHPGGMGLIGSTQADVLRGQTFADRETLRMDLVEPDPVTGDTKIWSEDFTAIEVMNGSSTNRFWGVARWWLTMIGRGFAPTGTAVTDTHRLYSDLGGSPRTWIFVPDGTDSPMTFDEQAFVTATNAGQAVGSRGPFMRISARNSNGEQIGLGETIANNSGTITVQVDLSLPEWMTVNTLETYINLEDVITSPGRTVDQPLTPTMSMPIDLQPEDLEVVATGTSVHRRYTKTVEFEVQTSVDAYVVIVVKGNQAMNPLAPGQTPFAFSNPFFIDADGGGYNNPPLAELANTPAQRVQGLSVPVVVTESLMREALEVGMCSH